MAWPSASLSSRRQVRGRGRDRVAAAAEVADTHTHIERDIFLGGCSASSDVAALDCTALKLHRILLRSLGVVGDDTYTLQRVMHHRYKAGWAYLAGYTHYRTPVGGAVAEGPLECQLIRAPGWHIGDFCKAQAAYALIYGASH